MDGAQRLDYAERIEVVTVPVGDLPDLVRRSEIVHSLVVSALSFFWAARRSRRGRGAGRANSCPRRRIGVIYRSNLY
jgi:hypothetical protein